MAARARKLDLSEDWKAKISASMLMNRLADHGSGKVRLGPTQVKAIEVVLDRLTPRLSTVEQTITDSRDNLSEDQVVGYLQGLFTAKPELLDKLIELRDAARLVQEGRESIAHASSTTTTIDPMIVRTETSKA